MMNVIERSARPRSRSALRRGLAHALLLAAVGLAVGIASLAPPIVTAQVETATPADEASVPADAAPAPVSQVPQAQHVPTDVQVRLGDTATLDGGALQVTFVDVAEDSRCPKDVMCVWMGRAVVWLHATVDGVDRGDVKTELYAGPRNPGSPDAGVVVDRYRLTLTDLQPYPTASTAGKVDSMTERTATLHVQ